MKKLLCIPLVVLFYTSSCAQVQWFQTGDEWTYDIHIGWYPYNGLHRLLVDKEVELAGKPWMRLLRHNPQYGGFSLFYVRQEGDRVYTLGYNNTEICLYDFSLYPGDTLFLSAFGQSPRYVILDTGSVFMAGQPRRTQTVKHSSLYYPLLLVEGIGPVGNPDEPNTPHYCAYFFINDNFCHLQGDGMSAYFKCFGSTNGVYAPFEGCLVDTKEQETTTPVQVWPNPADERLTVQGDCLTLRLFDSQGRFVYESTPLPESIQSEIPTADLPNGVYVLVCRLENGQLFSKRVCVLH